MPELVSFKGLPVKRRRRIGDRLHLILFSAEPGVPGQRLDVSQAEWAIHGSIQFFPKETFPDVRSLAARP